jgi:hypothetical protein
MKQERVRIAWKMEPDHTYEFVVGNVKPRRTAEKELERAKELARSRGEDEDVGFVVSEDTVYKRRMH